MRQFYRSLAQQPWLRTAVGGAPVIRSVARRFIAGEELEAGLTALRALNARGIKGTLNHVGTHVRNQPEAIAAADAVIQALCRIHEERLDSHLSVKLTQIGLDIDEELCRAQLRRILERSTQLGNFVRIDMEESVYTASTIRLFEKLRREYGADKLGIVVQSYLREHRGDLERLLAEESRVRLVKGGYWEPATVAYRKKADVNGAFAQDINLLLKRGRRPALATHDVGFINRARRIAAQVGLSKSDYEFQMLYGVRPDLQDSLAQQGHTVRCYVPYGRQWFSYVVGCARRIPGSVLSRVDLDDQPNGNSRHVFISRPSNPANSATAPRVHTPPTGFVGANRVCIIGAGAAGIAAAYALTAAGMNFDWFEAGSQPGGLWRHNNDSGLSAVYASMITNTSRPNMEWFGYSMPAATNDYLGHQEVLDYLEWFINSVGLRPKIKLAMRVLTVEPLETGGFRIVTRTQSGDESVRDYDSVIVAHGRNWSPRVPVVPGEFTGTMLHAFAYRTPELFAGQRVVVAGFGNSGADIVCDAADVAERAVLSTRDGGYLLSRYVGGKPRDQHNRSWFYRLPRAVRVRLARLILLHRGFSQKVQAALEANAQFAGKPPVVNDRLARLIDADRVIVRPAITRFDGKYVSFADGSVEESDILVWATGYRTVYPFFSPEVLKRNQDFQHRYLRVIPPAQPGLYFMGHISLAGPVFRVLERQALWVADLLAGRCGLPEHSVMARMAAKESDLGATIFPGTTRPEDNVEQHPYLSAVRREQARGKRRLRSAQIMARLSRKLGITA